MQGNPLREWWSTVAGKWGKQPAHGHHKSVGKSSIVANGVQ
jgi:hypothetical protein